MTMQLRCKVCAAIQPVTCPDEADEDPRTQAIRQAFRADHQTRCGDRTVALVSDQSFVGDPEPAPTEWETQEWPADVTVGADGFLSREIQRDGVTQAVRVCEDCWQNIPRYVEFPFGLVSPESDGDAQGNAAKTRRTVVEGKRGAEHLRKAVCLPCYLAAFRRVYPTADVPGLCADLIGDGTPVEPPAPPPDELFVAELGYEVTA